jgi:hypothetical protein
LRLALYEHPTGVDAADGTRVVYDLEADEAHFGAHGVAGPALEWLLADEAAPGAALDVQLDLDDAVDWMIRCDRIDFPPGGIAYRHTHPGAGIRRLLFGAIRIEGPDAHIAEFGPGGAWFEGFEYPVLATASESEPSAFVRVMLLPREWEGKRTIRYVDPADEEKPKLQRARIYFEQPL